MEVRSATPEGLGLISGLYEYARRGVQPPITAVHVVTILSYQLHILIPRRSSLLQDLRIMTNIGDTSAGTSLMAFLHFLGIRASTALYYNGPLQSLSCP